MDAAGYARLTEIFQAVVVLPEAERSQALDRECKGDAELRAEVEALLSHHRPESIIQPGSPGALAAELPYSDTSLAAGQSQELARRLDDALPLLLASWERYELFAQLGRGGMGTVYEGRDRRLGRHVAIKFISSGSPQITMRFLQEARAQARIEHPNICKVFEVGEVEGKAYIVMQLIRGVPLSSAASGMTLTEKVRAVRDVAAAMDVAHGLGVIHRDIKPGNIMVEKTAAGFHPVLMDFGLAREAGEERGLTESGAIMGTPAYMAPEQARGDVRKLDRRTDVYGLGATLYDILCGAPPFVDDSAVNLLIKVLVQEVVPLREKNPQIPEALDIIVCKCLNKEPHQRYDSAAALAEDLDRFLRREKVAARRLGFFTRLYWRGRRNKPLAVAVIGLVVSLLAFGSYGVRTLIQNARSEANARKRAVLAQKLGQAIKELEWLVRSAYLVPLHDTGPEKFAVRSRMAEIEAEIRSFGDIAAGLDHYALGRGHLALEEWEQAHSELLQAEAAGVRDPELDYALGRVLGELYSRGLEEARRSGDKSYREKRQQELERQYLGPALVRLDRCRGVKAVPASYLLGLIDFYRQHYEQALRNASLARREATFLYEAAKLQGDVFMAQALDARDQGDSDPADRYFQQAVSHYEQAVEIGRSDPHLYEALAESWIRQEEMDMFRGRDPRPKLEKAVAACDKALLAEPRESSGSTKKAFAYYFQAQYSQSHGASRQATSSLFQLQIDAGKHAIALHPRDAYAHEVTGLAYTRLAEQALELGQPAMPFLNPARDELKEAIRLNPSFPWAYNDYGLALGYSGDDRQRRNEDPRELYEQAIAASRRATELDEKYALAYNNTAVWLTNLADWQAEHGVDPQPSVAEAERAAAKAIEINRKNPLAYVNAGLALIKVATYRLDALSDGREAARKAISYYQTALGYDPTFVFVQRELGRAYYLLGSHERRLQLDPRASLEAGLHAIEACYRTEPNDPDCQAVEAQLRAEQGQLELAQRLAQKVAEKVPDRGELWLLLGQLSLRRAESSAAGQTPPAVLDEGLQATERVLKQAPGMPRALAIRGALLLRKGLFEQARASLSQAFAQNPLLKRSYGKAD